jgi:murein L,D-transpeptidase YcbB/YkuD
MIIYSSTKKAAFAALLLPLILLSFQSCKKKRSDMANDLVSKTHNKVFKDVTPEGFAVVFQKMLENDKTKLSNSEVISAFYEQNEYDPEFVMDHLFNSDLSTATAFFMKAGDHGLNPKMFQTDEIRALLNKFYDKKGIKTVDEAYRDMAQLEILSANALLKYTSALEYGLVNPSKMYVRYYTVTKHADSSYMMKVLHTPNIKHYLDSIQPKDPQYLALQQALASNAAAPGLSAEETKRVLIVNLERLRWKNKPAEKKYVIVNIPDYYLNVIEDGKSILNMKVCVGEGRNKTNSNTLLAYNDTAKVDKPYPKETPQLNSLIHSVDVNPVWNIPQSIANKEIIVAAAKDPYYLANKNINVYKNGKLIEPDGIDWSKVTNNSDYEFKQKPGEDNSLGKIKFLFKNKSNVYLHDTPAKQAFDLASRDVSHGCVRLGDPQGLALNLFGEGEKYQTIAKDMGEDNPEPTTIYLPKKVPVYITYVTCWADDTGTLQYRQDVYGMDIVLYDHLLKAGI